MASASHAASGLLERGVRMMAQATGHVRADERAGPLGRLLGWLTSSGAPEPITARTEPILPRPRRLVQNTSQPIPLGRSPTPSSKRAGKGRDAIDSKLTVASPEEHARSLFAWLSADFAGRTIFADELAAIYSEMCLYFSWQPRAFRSFGPHLNKLLGGKTYAYRDGRRSRVYRVPTRPVVQLSSSPAIQERRAA